MSEFFVEAGGIRARVQRKKVKCIRLYVKPPDGRVHISMPSGCAIETVRKFVESKREWILEKQAQCRSVNALSAQQTETTVLLWGERLELTVEENAVRNIAEPVGGGVVVRTKPGSGPEVRTALLDEMYRRLLLDELPAIAEKWQRIMGIEAEEWRTRRMKTRWGTCNVQQKRIWLNLRLAALPRECLEYVAVHELCHLHEPSHNQRFRMLMTGYLPEWSSIRSRMKTMSGVLY